VAAPARSTAADLLGNEVTDYRASGSNALEAHTKEVSHEPCCPLIWEARNRKICIRQPDGTIVKEGKIPARKLTEIVATWTPSRVVMETSAEAFRMLIAA
jgi:hypothetical protein